MSRRIFLLLTIILAINFGAESGIKVPEDGTKQDLWYLTGDCAVMPEGFAAGKVWDMSDAVIDRHTSRLYRQYGDTLMARIQDGEREIFRISPDTVTLIGRGDRHCNSYSQYGIPYLYTAGKSPMTFVDSVYSATPYGHLTSEVAGIEISYSPSGGFRFPDGGTVERSTLVHTVSTNTYGRTDSYRWYAEGLLFPVVEYTIIRKNGEDIQASETAICPPSEQPGPVQKAPVYAPSSALFIPGNGQDGQETESISMPQYVMSCSGNVLQVTFIGVSDGSLCGVTLCDVAGRVYMQSGGGCAFGLSALPQGAYLVTVTVDGNNHTEKLWIH